MTEEIIIDGINVAGCEFYFKDEKYSCNLSFINQEELCKCNDVQDCYYKQLKRLEQENKELKEMLSKEPKAMQAFQIAYSSNKKENEVLWGMVKDYKSALEEIREIIRTDCKRCTAECDCDDDCTRYKIKTKINEILQ